MKCLVCCLVMMAVVVVQSRPRSYDMQSVGSLRREVRQLATEVDDLLAVAPVAAPRSAQIKQHKKPNKNVSGKSNEGGFYKQFGSDADAEKGYLKKTYANGNHGYKNYDTFHKQIGDRYGFEEHEETGKGSAADSGRHEGKSKSKHSRRKQTGDHEGAGTDDVESYYSSGEGGGDYAGYSGGGGDGGDGGESSSYSDGSGEGYSESYASGDDGDGGDGGDGEAYSGESYSSGEGDGSYY